MSEPKPCERCGTLFQPKRKGHRYCTYKCGAEQWHLDHQEESRVRSYNYFLTHNKKPDRHIACLWCGAEIVTAKQDQKYCSSRCAHRHRYKLNPQKYRDKANRLRRENIERHREKDRRHDALRKDKKKIYFQNLRATQPWLVLVRAAKERAKQDNLPFTITVEWAKQRWTGCCELTGIPFESGTERFFSPSIDKINPILGYTEENSRIILCSLNIFKQRATDGDVYRVCKAFVVKQEAIGRFP